MISNNWTHNLNWPPPSRFALIRFWNYSRDYSLNCVFHSVQLLLQINVLLPHQEAEALLTEWQRLTVCRFSVCPLCNQKGKATPCLFSCSNWLSSNPQNKGLSAQTKICKASSWLGEKFPINLIYPPPGKLPKSPHIFLFTLVLT